jgi:hypothetical protein
MQAPGLVALIGEDEFQHFVRVLAQTGVEPHAKVIHNGRGRSGDHFRQRGTNREMVGPVFLTNTRFSRVPVISPENICV